MAGGGRQFSGYVPSFVFDGDAEVCFLLLSVSPFLIHLHHGPDDGQEAEVGSDEGTGGSEAATKRGRVKQQQSGSRNGAELNAIDAASSASPNN